MRITTSIKDFFKATPQHSISWENVCLIDKSLHKIITVLSILERQSFGI